MLRKRANTFLLYFFLLPFLFISIFPFYWMFVGSTNKSGDVLSTSPKMTFGGEFLHNLVNLNEQIDVVQVLFNSLFISITYVVLTLTISSIAGFALAKYQFKGKKLFFGLIIGSMMVPFQSLMVPLFKMMSDYNIINTSWAVILPTVCSPFAIFLLRQSFLAFPNELIEAARIDGASDYKTFFTIVLPSMKPALSATAIYLFMQQWNNFMWPLVALQTSDKYNFPVALASLKGLASTDYGQMMLGISLSALPVIVLFLALQKQFIAGMLGSGIK